MTDATIASLTPVTPPLVGTEELEIDNGSSFKVTVTEILGATNAGHVTGTGNNVRATAPTIANLTVTGGLTATGLVTNADLASAVQSAIAAPGLVTGAVKANGAGTYGHAAYSDLATGAPTATSSALGLVKPDNTTISIDGSGVISSTGGVLQSVTVALTNDDLLHLFSSPVPIIPAPGAGNMILVNSAVYSMKYGTTPFLTTDNTIALFYGTDASGDNADDEMAAWATFQSTEDQMSKSNQDNSVLSPSVSYTDVVNLGIVLASPTANMTAGDSTGSVTVTYTIVPLAS